MTLKKTKRGDEGVSTVHKCPKCGEEVLWVGNWQYFGCTKCDYTRPFKEDGSDGGGGGFVDVNGLISGDMHDYRRWKEDYDRDWDDPFS